MAKKEKVAKTETKAEEVKVNVGKATEHDFDVIIAPVITEKSMALMQNQNKVTVKVSPKANKAEIKIAFERVFQVEVTEVQVSNQRAKSTTRGGRYPGHISGYKKAICTVSKGQAIDL